MDSIRLSRDADELICVIYKKYLDRRQLRIPKDKASAFDGSKYIQERLLPNWSFENVDATCMELGRAGLLEYLRADGCVYKAYLSEQGIIYMENRFADGLTSLLSHLASLKSLLPTDFPISCR